MSTMAAGSWKRAVTGIVLGTAIACAGSQKPPFETLCADEHERKAQEAHERADKHIARVRADHEAEDTLSPGDQGWKYLGSPQVLYDPDESEHYTLDPRIHSPSERDVDKGRRYRDLALQHESAAAALNGSCPTSSGG